MKKYTIEFEYYDCLWEFLTEVRCLDLKTYVKNNYNGYGEYDKEAQEVYYMIPDNRIADFKNDMHKIGGTVEELSIDCVEN